jgi:hypothetical protein
VIICASVADRSLRACFVRRRFEGALPLLLLLLLLQLLLLRDARRRWKLLQIHSRSRFDNRLLHRWLRQPFLFLSTLKRYLPIPFNQLAPRHQRRPESALAPIGIGTLKGWFASERSERTLPRRK